MRNATLLALVAFVGCSAADQETAPPKVDLAPIESRLEELESRLVNLETSLEDSRRQTDKTIRELVDKINVIAGYIESAQQIDTPDEQELIADRQQQLETHWKLLTDSEQKQVERIRAILQRNTLSMPRDDLDFVVFGRGQPFLLPMAITVAEQELRNIYVPLEASPREALAMLAIYGYAGINSFKFYAKGIKNGEAFNDAQMERIRSVPCLHRMWTKERLKKE